MDIKPVLIIYLYLKRSEIQIKFSYNDSQMSTYKIVNVPLFRRYRKLAVEAKQRKRLALYYAKAIAYDLIEEYNLTHDILPTAVRTLYVSTYWKDII